MRSPQHPGVNGAEVDKDSGSMCTGLAPSRGVYRGQSDHALPKEVQLGACSKPGIFPVGRCVCACWPFCAQRCQAVVLMDNALTRPPGSHHRCEPVFSNAQPCIRSRVSVLSLHFCTSLVVNVEMLCDMKPRALASSL